MFLEFESYDEEQVFVNPKMVTHLMPYEEDTDYTTIVLVDSDVIVEGIAEDVATYLAKHL